MKASDSLALDWISMNTIKPGNPGLEYPWALEGDVIHTYKPICNECNQDHRIITVVGCGSQGWHTKTKRHVVGVVIIAGNLFSVM